MNLDFFEELLTDNPDNFVEFLPDDILTAESPIFPHTNALNFAAYHNCRSAVRYLQENIPELMHIESRLKPAHYAAMFNSVDTLESLAKNVSTEENLTPLMLAAYYNQFEAASALIFTNIGQVLRSDCLGMPAGSTALAFALKQKSREVATLLLPYESFIQRDEVSRMFLELFKDEPPFFGQCGCFVQFEVFLQQSYQFLVARDDISQQDERYRTPRRETQQTRDLEVSAGMLRDENTATKSEMEEKDQCIERLREQIASLQEELAALEERGEKIVVLRPTTWKQRKFREGKKDK